MYNEQPGFIFRTSFLLLLCLSALILTSAENFIFPQILGIPIILFAYTYVDKKQVFEISSTFAAFLGFVAILLGFIEFLLGGPEAKILSPAHLVSYLLWITLLQKKDPRQYWWLLALSVMQIAVASVLTSDKSFGIGILLYLFLIIWTLSFFSVYRATLRIRTAVNQVQSQAVAKPANREQQVVTRKTFLETTKSTARGSIYLNPGEPWISWQFFGGVISITLLSLTVAGVFFVFTPRLWLGRIPFPSDTKDSAIASNISGFNESVRLGEMGTIMENPAPVFKAVITRSETGNRASDEEFCTNNGMEALLFRGGVMTRYSMRSGRSNWKIFPNMSDGNFNFNQNSKEIYNVEIEQLQTTGNNLFSLGRFGNTHETNDAIGAFTYDTLSGTLKSNFVGNLKYKFSVYDPILYKDHFCLRVGGRTFRTYSDLKYLQECSSYPENDLQGLKKYTDDLILNEQKKLNYSMSKLDIALFLENHLQHSPEFSYSLKQSVQNPNIDPVEDFVLNRKSGHCEYFSSALALMLRTQNIPSRLISGFKGGTYNPNDQVIEVKQLHAHAWLEFFDEESIHWITLDPTPAAARETEIAKIESATNTEDFNLGTLLTNLWNNNVVNMSLEQQRTSLYMPIYNSLVNSWENMKGIRRFAGLTWEIAVEIFRDPKQLFSLKGFMLVSILGGFAVGIWLLFNRIIPSIRQRILNQNSRYRNNLKVIFYEKYLQFLRKLHQFRKEEQTPLELSAQASKYLDEKAPEFHQSKQLIDVTEAYYRIRFGNYEIKDEEQQHWLNVIDQLEAELKLLKI